MGARAINLVLAAWLLISSLLFRMPQTLKLDGVIVGALCLAMAAAAIWWRPVVRYGITALSLWMFFTAFAFGGTYPAATWHHVIIAGFMFIVSLAPAENEIPMFHLHRDWFHTHHHPHGPQAA